AAWGRLDPATARPVEGHGAAGAAATAAAPVTAPRAAEALRLGIAQEDLTTLVEHLDEEFLLHVPRRR
ncbi:hypothetical protein, partial [Pseudonocardia lacus]|uniref:hypothetical protein n=1 Tax=Pseudonocardia lacus TaxID=2835865 RepID=UPI001BDC73B5